MAYIVEKQPSKLASGILEWIETIVFSVAAVLFLLTFLLTTVIVDGASMQPTLADENLLVASPFVLRPKRGDIVIVAKPNPEEKLIIKRVIGLPGERVDIDFLSGEVSVDGRVLDEPYLVSKTYYAGDVSFPLVVPQGEVFVLGDNRDISWDSRMSTIGTVDIRHLRGTALFRVLPFSQIGPVA